MAKEIAFHISVENTALQQLLKDLGNLTTLYDKLTKSQDTLNGSTIQIAATQEKILKIEKQILAEGNKSVTVIQKQSQATKELLTFTIQKEQADKKAVGTINELNAEKKRLTEAINGLNLKTEEGKAKFFEYSSQLKAVSAEVGFLNATVETAAAGSGDFSAKFSSAFSDFKSSVSSAGGTIKTLKETLDSSGITIYEFSRGFDIASDAVEKAEKVQSVYQSVIKLGAPIVKAFEVGMLSIKTAKLAYKNGVVAATIVQKAFNVAVKSNPLGLIVTLLASAAAAFASYKLGSEESTESQKDFNTALTETQELLQEAAKAETMVKILDKLDKRQAEAFKQNVEKQIQANEDLLAKQAVYKQRQLDLSIELQKLTVEYQQTNDKEIAKSLYNYYKEYQKTGKLIKEINETDIKASIESLTDVYEKTTDYIDKLSNKKKVYANSVNGLNEKISDLIKEQNDLNLSTEKGAEKYKEYAKQIEEARQALAKYLYEAENGKVDPLEPLSIKPVQTTKIDDPNGGLPEKVPQKIEGVDTSVENRTDVIKTKAQEAADAFGKMNEALDVAEQISEVRLQNELARIEEKRDAEIEAVNNSVASEEDKKARIDSINAKYDKEAEGKKKAAAKREKAFAITKTIIAGAQAAAQGIAQFGPPPSPPGIAALAAAAITTATQLALIAKQKFAKGGYIPFETGGMIQGASHAQGGVPFMAGGAMMEAEGGELVVNRNIWSRPDFVKNISEMNAITGGRRFFAAGGMVPTASPPTYVSTATIPAETFDNEAMINGLRGVIAQEVGSIKVVNNVVDTTSQQQRLLNIQTEASF